SRPLICDELILARRANIPPYGLVIFQISLLCERRDKQLKRIKGDVETEMVSKEALKNAQIKLFSDLFGYARGYEWKKAI
ncbi:MAG: hypothetical protein J0I75_28555, partial [Hyphomicrobium sp.]|nr:hypothetical protein [Hyphomicrobium sp.]